MCAKPFLANHFGWPILVNPCLAKISGKCFGHFWPMTFWTKPWFRILELGCLVVLLYCVVVVVEVVVRTDDACVHPDTPVDALFFSKKCPCRHDPPRPWPCTCVKEQKDDMPTVQVAFGAEQIVDVRGLPDVCIDLGSQIQEQ